MGDGIQVGGHFEEIEREFVKDPIGRFTGYALLFHVLLFGSIIGFAYLEALFPHSNWGGNNDGGAIQVQLVSSAIPLPSVHPPSENVLATEKPSEAPAPPTPKAKETYDEQAIPIPSKIESPKKQAKQKQQASAPPKPVVAPPNPRTSAHQQPAPNNKAAYGEQAANNMPRAMQPTTVSSNGQVAVTGGARGFNYPYYVDNIQRKMKENLYRGEVDPRTPAGARTYIFFVIRRDGTATDVRLDRSSGSPTLDQACLRAARRVDTFGPLPSPPSDGNLNVSYFCDYDQ